MARTLDNHQTALANHLTDTRKAEKMLDVSFRAWVAEQRITQFAAVRRAVEDAVLGAYDAGVTVARISEYYGTKDRATITRIISARDVSRNIVASLQPAKSTFFFEDVTAAKNPNTTASKTNDGQKVYSVTLTGYREIDHTTNKDLYEITGTGWWVVGEDGYVAPHPESYYDRDADATYYELNVMTETGSRLQQYAQAWLDTQR